MSLRRVPDEKGFMIAFERFSELDQSRCEGERELDRSLVGPIVEQ